MLTLPTKSYYVFEKFMREHTELVYWYIVLSISNAIRNNVEKADLFTFGISQENSAIVTPNNYEKVIQAALNIFTANEEYERAAFARDLLVKWKIEQAIKTNTVE